MWFWGAACLSERQVLPGARWQAALVTTWLAVVWHAAQILVNPATNFVEMYIHLSMQYTISVEQYERKWGIKNSCKSIICMYIYIWKMHITEVPIVCDIVLHYSYYTVLMMIICSKLVYKYCTDISLPSPLKSPCLIGRSNSAGALYVRTTLVWNAIDLLYQGPHSIDRVAAHAPGLGCPCITGQLYLVACMYKRGEACFHKSPVASDHRQPLYLRAYWQAIGVLDCWQPTCTFTELALLC